ASLADKAPRGARQGAAGRAGPAAGGDRADLRLCRPESLHARFLQERGVQSRALAAASLQLKDPAQTAGVRLGSNCDVAGGGKKVRERTGNRPPAAAYIFGC